MDKETVIALGIALVVILILIGFGYVLGQADCVRADTKVPNYQEIAKHHFALNLCKRDLAACGRMVEDFEEGCNKEVKDVEKISEKAEKEF